MTKVLVTGATGFVASHLILQLIDRGFDVRGTMRSLEKGETLKRVLSDYAGKPIPLELFSADLSSDQGWAEAVNGVEFVQHVASPFPATQPKNADELIGPAKDGALRVLKAARDAKVKRVVLTSSVAAVDTGWQEAPPEGYDETYWAKLDDPDRVSFYAQSKALAEKAAWDFIAREGDGLEMAVINPVGVLGPAMSKDVSTSFGTVVHPLSGKMPGYPRIHQAIVDVRDVAAAHIEAMLRPEAAGERFIVSAQALWLREIGAVLAAAYPDRAVPDTEIPDEQVKLAAESNPGLQMLLPNLGRPRPYSNAKAREVLDIDFIPAKEALLASADSAIKLGMI